MSARHDYPLTMGGGGGNTHEVDKKIDTEKKRILYDREEWRERSTNESNSSRPLDMSGTQVL